MNGVIFYLGLVNFFAFVLYGADKKKAVEHAFRIPEKTLLFIACIGGALGSLIGMFFFRHKIRKPKFFLTVPILCIVQGICFGMYFIDGTFFYK